MSDIEIQPAATAGEPKLRLGGMALNNGLLVYGPTHWSAAVRTNDGQIICRSGKMPRLPGPAGDVPGVRGIVRLAEAFAVLPAMRAKLPQARLPFEKPAVLAAAATVTALGAALRRRRGRTVSTELVVSLMGLAPAVLSLRQGETASYHGVEHKSIAAYEHGLDDATGEAKEHDRCGSHLITPMIAAAVAGDAIVRKMVKHPGGVAQASVAVGSVAASVEAFVWCERHPESPLAKAFRAPGFEIQRVVGTREPSQDQLDVGRAAIAELLRVEGVAA